MAVNLDKIKQERAKRQFAGELIDFPEGDTGTYVAAGPRDGDEVPFWHTKMHYGLGPKGFSQAMCLEPANNPLLNDPAFLEQVALLKKDLSGGCAVCEAIDRGEKVSGKDDQDGKPNSRWLWIVMPIQFRPDPRSSWSPSKADEVKGYLVGYKVWDKICDQFGSCGDITDPDAVTLIRVIREGKKMQTKWDIQPDIETAKKPLKLTPNQRKVIAEMVKVGGPCDPMRIFASMARSRSDVIDLLKGIKAATDDGAYEEVKPEDGGTAEPAPADEGKFKPPGKEGKAKPEKAEGKPKTEARPKAADGDAELKKLTGQHGAPPNCFKVDPDPNEPMCQACPFKVICANHCGVPVPPDPAEEQTDEGSADDAPVEADGITVEQATIDALYTIGDTDDQYTYKGPAKGKHLFLGPDGKPVKLDNGAIVKPVEGSTDEDPGLKALEAQLAAKKAKKKA